MSEPKQKTSMPFTEPASPENNSPEPPAWLSAAENAPTGDTTFCTRCGYSVPFELNRCPQCGSDVNHHPSMVQRYGLLGGMGFIILGGILVFLQPRAYHTFMQDVFEVGIIACVIGAGVCFFTAVVDMVRRGGE